jgi:hypothetical protein
MSRTRSALLLVAMMFPLIGLGLVLDLTGVRVPVGLWVMTSVIVQTSMMFTWWTVTSKSPRS